MPGNDVEVFKEKIQNLLWLRTKKEQAEEALKTLNLELQEENRWCAAWLVNHEVKSLNLDGVGRCEYGSTTYPTVEDAELMMADLRTMGAEALIKETVHAQTLKAFVNERLEQNLPLPKGLKTYTKEYVKIKGGK